MSYVRIFSYNYNFKSKQILIEELICSTIKGHFIRCLLIYSILLPPKLLLLEWNMTLGRSAYWIN